MTRTHHVLKLVAGAAIGYSLVACWPHAAKSQVAAPAGTPAGANWVNGGRAGGGIVMAPGQPYDQYRFTDPKTQPYTLNPGAGYQMLGLGVGAAASLAGQPVAGGIAAGALGAIAGQVDKTRPPQTPTIVERTAPTTGAAVGGIVSSTAPGASVYNSFSAAPMTGAVVLKSGKFAVLGQ